MVSVKATPKWFIPSFPTYRTTKDQGNQGTEGAGWLDHARRQRSQGPSKTVAVIGGGLSGLACGKYLSDAKHRAAGEPQTVFFLSFGESVGVWVLGGLF